MEIFRNDLLKYGLFLLLFTMAMICYQIGKRDAKRDTFDSKTRYMKAKKYVALTISSLLFALFHITNNNLTTISFINIFLSGVFLGLFYAYFKNLWFSIAAHFAWNFFQGPVLGSEVSGLKTASIFKQTLIGNDLLTGGAFGFEASISCTSFLLLFIFLLYFWCEDRLLMSELNASPVIDY